MKTPPTYLPPPSAAPPTPFSEVDERATPAEHAGNCSSGSRAGARGGMWPRVLLGEARAAAGGYGAVLSRFAVRFSPPWTAGSGLPLRRSLHGTAPRAFPLIPIVVEQTVRGPGRDIAWRLEEAGRRAMVANLSPLFFSYQGRGERAYDIYSRLLRERIVCVMGPVSDPGALWRHLAVSPNFLPLSSSVLGHPW